MNTKIDTHVIYIYSLSFDETVIRIPFKIENPYFRTCTIESSIVPMIKRTTMTATASSSASASAMDQLSSSEGSVMEKMVSWGKLCPEAGAQSSTTTATAGEVAKVESSSPRRRQRRSRQRTSSSLSGMMISGDGSGTGADAGDTSGEISTPVGSAMNLRELGHASGLGRDDGGLLSTYRNPSTGSDMWRMGVDELDEPTITTEEAAHDTSQGGDLIAAPDSTWPLSSSGRLKPRRVKSNDSLGNLEWGDEPTGTKRAAGKVGRHPPPSSSSDAGSPRRDGRTAARATVCPPSMATLLDTETSPGGARSTRDSGPDEDTVGGSCAATSDRKTEEDDRLVEKGGGGDGARGAARHRSRRNVLERLSRKCRCGLFTLAFL